MSLIPALTCESTINPPAMMPDATQYPTCLSVLAVARKTAPPSPSQIPRIEYKSQVDVVPFTTEWQEWTPPVGVRVIEQRMCGSTNQAQQQERKELCWRFYAPPPPEEA